MGETRDFVAEYAAAEATWVNAIKRRDEAAETARSARIAVSAIVVAKWGCASGTRIIDGRGREYAVAIANGGDLSNRPYLYGHPLKLDGTPSKQRRYVGSTWTLRATP